jgi:hypothetical protein
MLREAYSRFVICVLILIIVVIGCLQFSTIPQAQAHARSVMQTITKTLQYPVIASSWDTGIDLFGGTLSFTATGNAAVSLDGSGLPSGDPPCVVQNQPPNALFPLPGGTCNALVGKSGINGAYFQIGSGGTVFAPVGRLYLDVNTW